MQLERSRRGVLTGLIALAVALVAAGNAHADTRRISDGNDRPGPLDIRSASHGHAGTRVVHTISTFGRWRAGLLGRSTPNLFAVEISTDRDRALERVVLVFSANGRMTALVIRLPGGRVIGSASASKPNARTVRVSIPRSRLGNPVSYRWTAHSQYRAAGACGDFCIDKAPNSGRVMHDITAPAIVLTSFPSVPSDIEYDVSFRVSDAGGAGLRRWLLQHRPLGTSSWATVDSGAAAGLQSHHHMSDEDTDDQFRVVAVDRQGNQRISPVKLVSVPIDDASLLLVYSGTWAHGAGDPLDFRDTLSSSTDTGAGKVELTFTGRYVAWIAPGADAGATVWFDGMYDEIGLLGFSGRRNVVWEHTFASVGTHNLRIEPLFGTVPIDGIIVR